jgi:hypothetical protein
MAEALAGLSHLRSLWLCGLMPGAADMDRAGAAECAATVAVLPPSLGALMLDWDSSCVEGAALVVPPDRAQQLGVWLRYGLSSSRVRTGRATVEDMRTFLRWLLPGLLPGRDIDPAALYLGGCPKLGVYSCIRVYRHHVYRVGV